jgi:CHAT domain-containing protein
MFKQLLILTVYLLLKLSLCGQCPDRDMLWHRIIYLRDSSKVPTGEQLNELQGYLEKMNDCPYRNDSTHALLLSRIGWLTSLQKDFVKAIAFTNHSIDMIHAHAGMPDINEAQLIKCYNNLVILYDSTSQEKLKTKSMDSCISLVVKLKTGYPFAMRYINMELQYFFAKGDYYHCLNYATLGEDITRKSRYFPEDVFYYISWKINALIFLNKYEEAEQLADRSIRECIQTRNKKYLGSLLGLEGNIAEERADVVAAIYYARKSLFLNKKAGNYRGCSETLTDLGYRLYFRKLHQNDKALKYYNKALKYADDNDAINILDNISNVYVQKKYFDSAFYFYQLAFNKMNPGFDENSLLKSSGEDISVTADAEYMINLVLDKADAYLFIYKQTKDVQNLQQAEHIYKVADRLMDKIKITQTELSSKLFWRTDTRRLYEHAIECCFLSGNREQAFYFFEKSRAVLLNDQLREQQTGGADILQMAMIKKKILQLERANTGLDPASQQYSDIQRALFINKQELSRTDQLIKEHNPWYYQSLLDTNFITLKEVQKSLLGNDHPQVILEFFNGDSSVYLLTLTSKNCNVTRINKNDFEKEVDRYMSYLSSPSLLNQDFTGFTETAGQLYQLLFKLGPLPAGRIIISPDGRYFPFEALITNTHVAAPVYFLNEHIVSYTYSVRYLMNDFTKSTTVSSGDFLGVAPVNYTSSFHLASLPESDVSVEKIGSYFSKTHSLIAGQASKNNFMQQFPAYKIIQLYTHASDSSGNGEPVIYFADSALYLSELIPENKTAAQLIVLSACETGNGKLYKGEGVFSFNRGFAALGIPSSVTNLWSVDDESTYRLTELFYKYVAKGMPLDLALQKAKLDFIASASKEKSLPYYWAATIIAGKTNTLDISGKFPWVVFFFITGILCLSFLVVRILQNNNKKTMAGGWPPSAASL